MINFASALQKSTMLLLSSVGTIIKLNCINKLSNTIIFNRRNGVYFLSFNEQEVMPVAAAMAAICTSSEV